MKYVVAVSGGVDSMVLLHQLVTGVCKSLQVAPENIVVAHIDHGIREDSWADEELVKRVASKYGLSYESFQANLGQDVSEEQARKVRYKLLRQCCKKYNAQLVTAHHQDDVIETMIINLLRGTGWRGLVSLGSGPQAVRPLLAVTKSELVVYAKKHALRWREDSTNVNEAYLRNYVRLRVLPSMLAKNPNATTELLAINKKVLDLKNNIATELQNIISKYQISNTEYIVPRYSVIMWPAAVSSEVLYAVARKLDASWHPNKQQILKLVHFIKTAQPLKEFQLSENIKISTTLRAVQFKKH
jgi:tRNA(Ile)-lysidine synthase